MVSSWDYNGDSLDMDTRIAGVRSKYIKIYIAHGANNENGETAHTKNS